MGWDPVLRHLDHLLSVLGEDHVGFGSDFDGATVPEGISDVAGLPRLCAAMEAHGYGDALMRKLTMRQLGGACWNAPGNNLTAGARFRRQRAASIAGLITRSYSCRVIGPAWRSSTLPSPSIR
jgi:hypothetical protein